MKYLIDSRAWWWLHRRGGNLIWRIAILFDGIRLREHQRADRIYGRPHPTFGHMMIGGISSVPTPRIYIWRFCIRWYHWWLRRYNGWIRLLARVERHHFPERYDEDEL